MTKAHSISTLAAIGGFTAVIALQTGLTVAKADELADLRANQQLLQQRIDQLAQAQAQAPARKPRPRRKFPAARAQLLQLRSRRRLRRPS